MPVASWPKLEDVMVSFFGLGLSPPLPTAPDPPEPVAAAIAARTEQITAIREDLARKPMSIPEPEPGWAFRELHPLYDNPRSDPKFVRELDRGLRRVVVTRTIATEQVPATGVATVANEYAAIFPAPKPEPAKPLEPLWRQRRVLDLE
jgi:hypothetical protein